jgi:hypothetical protein
MPSTNRELALNRLRRHVPQQNLLNTVMDQNATSGQLQEGVGVSRCGQSKLQPLQGLLLLNRVTIACATG